MYIQSLLFLFLMANNHSSAGAQEEQEMVKIAAIFDLTNFAWGSELFQFTMDNLKSPWLRELIPEINTDAIQTTDFSYEIKNGECDPTTAVRAYWDVRSENENMAPHGVIGAYCSGATVSLARISGLEAVPLVNPFSTTSRLSNDEEFPYVARLLAPDNENGEVGALVATLRMLGWDRVSLLTTDTSYAKDWATEFRNLWESTHNDNGGPCEVAYANTIKVLQDGSIDKESAKMALTQAPVDNPEVNSRIIVFASHDQHVYPVLKMAKERNFQPDTIWVGTCGWVGLELDEGVSSWLSQYPGYIGTAPYRNEDQIHDVFLQKVQESQRQSLVREEPVWEFMPMYSSQLVDGILTLLMGITAMEPSQRRRGDLIIDKIKALDFNGVSGKVHFATNGDPKDPQLSILQLKQERFGNHEEYAWKSLGSIGTQLGSGSLNGAPFCFPENGCVSRDEIPGDSYPVPRDKLPKWAIAIIAVSIVLLVAIILKYWRSHRSKQSIKQELDAFRDSVVGMRTAETNYIPFIAQYSMEPDVEQPKPSSVLDKNKKLKVSPQSKIQWVWQETPSMMVNHDPEEMVGDPALCWIKYDDEANTKLEKAYQTQKTDCHPIKGYQVVLSTMIQTKKKTGFERQVQRWVETAQPTPTEEPKTIDMKKTEVGSILPQDIQSEPKMVLVGGDVVQISKQRQDGWAFGTKLHHQDAAVERELVAYVSGEASGDDANVFPDTGWFELDATRLPSADDLAILQETVGDTSALEPPSHWDPMKDPTIVQKHTLNKGDEEYNRVVAAFKATLQNRKITSIEIERVQNLAMWQSYVVKRQTICFRETGLTTKDKKKKATGKASEADNATALRKALDRFERCWLWHGTNAGVKEKILQQGFNRSFCGKNATLYGKGVYFARDASYSSYKNYAVPDAKGYQYILACRVVVGEYCRGKQDAVTPELRDAKTQSLYDTTVGLLSNDDMVNPSIYVTYHDSQAYPEYLIKFKQAS